MGRPIPAWAIIAAMVAPIPALAADFDGSVPLICALADLRSCSPDEDCRRETAFSVNLPTLVRIDAVAKTIDGKRPDAESRRTAIDTVGHSEEGLVLQGIDGGRSWNAVIDPSGRLSLAAIGQDGGFVVFGECVKP